MNPIVTPAMFAIMRDALGLGPFNKRPTRNNIVLASRGGQADPKIVDQMIDMELLSKVERAGPGGREFHIMVTGEGMRLTVDAQHQYNVLADAIQAEHKQEHESEFGISKKHPFIANGQRIHAEAIRRMAEIEGE